MNNDWSSFLAQHSPQAIVAEAAIMPLSSWRVITVQGSDATRFLQNLCTNDVNALAIDQAQLNSLCNPKGRVVAIFWLLRRQESYQLILPNPVCDSLLKRLTMYILRSDVSIEAQTDSLILLGCTHDLLNQDKHLNPLQGKQYDNNYIVRLPGATTRTLILTDNTDAIALAQKHLWVEETSWQKIDIESGIPFIFNETVEQFTPQQISLDLRDGVSFSKGCYPGQEIVARLHYLGTPSRRLFSAITETDTLPAPGSHVILEDQSVVGHIVQAHRNESTTWLLVSLKIANQDQDLLLADSTLLMAVAPVVSE